MGKPVRCLTLSDGGDEPLHRRVDAGVAPLADLTGQPGGRELREGSDALTQIVEVGSQLAQATGLSGTVRRRLQATGYVFRTVFGSAPCAGRWL
jgi:hypothetical protein